MACLSGSFDQAPRQPEGVGDELGEYRGRGGGPALHEVRVSRALEHLQRRPGDRLPGQQEQRLPVPDDVERDAHRNRAVPVSEGPAPSAATANSAASPSREPAATIREGWNAGRTSR